MKIRIWTGCAALIVALGAAPAHSAGDRHEVKALHGGIVAEAAHIDFELVARPGGAMIYVRDHGKPVSTEGASGKLTVLDGGRKTDTVLKPSGENALAAAELKLGAGAKAVASISLAGRRPIAVRFAVK